MEVLAIIPARGGSKSIPDKNIFPLNGKPLIGYTCEAALGSTMINRLIISTDSVIINDIAVRYGAESPFLRPDDLAKDDTPAFPVIEYTLQRLKENENYVPDIIVLLQPTSPLRTAVHIDESIQKFITSKSDVLVSVVEVPHQFNPYSILKPEGEGLVNFIEQNNSVLRRQDKPKFYARNGPAILILDVNTLLNRKSLYGTKVAYYEMDAKSSMDIDSMLDLKLIEGILNSEY